MQCVTDESLERLTTVGRWLRANGEAVYGQVDRVTGMEWNPISTPLPGWTRKGKTLYFWVGRWPGRELALGGLRGKLRRATLLGSCVKGRRGSPMRACSRACARSMSAPTMASATS